MLGIIHFISAASIDKFISEIYKVGFTITPQIRSENKDYPVATLAIELNCNNTIKDIKNSEVEKIFRDILVNNKISYYSIIVIEGWGAMSYSPSNITLEDLKKKKLEKINKSNLKLVRSISPDPQPEKENS